MSQEPEIGAVAPAAPRRPAKPEGRSMAGPLVIGLLAVAAFGGGMWFAYKEGYKAGAKHAPKVVAADASPTKSAPENAGGMTVPHQDKTVFALVGKDGTRPAESVAIRPSAEEPVAKPEATAEATKTNGVGKPIQLFPPQAPTPAPPPTPVAQQQTAPADTAAAQSTQQVAVVTPTTPLASGISSPSSGGGWRLQLASLKSEEAVQKSWADLQRKHADVLGGLRSDVVRVDLGAEKGIYFRLMAGPIASRDEANAKCDQLKAQKVACLVARN